MLGLSVGERLGIKLGISDGLPLGFSDGLGNLLGITTSPSFGDARITLAHTALLVITLETLCRQNTVTGGTKGTGRTLRKFTIRTTWDDEQRGTKLRQQFGNAAGIGSDKIHGILLGTAKTK